MKRITALLLALMLAASLCACDTAQPMENPFISGTVAGNRYESTFAGVACQLSNQWTFQTQQQIQEHSAQTGAWFGGDYPTDPTGGTVVMDMLATHENGVDALSVTFEKRVGIALTQDAAAYAEVNGANVAQTLKSAGVENLSWETGTILFAGKQHAAARFTGSYGEIQMYETMVFVAVGEYMMLVSATAWYENTTEEILANFTAI